MLHLLKLFSQDIVKYSAVLILGLFSIIYIIENGAVIENIEKYFTNDTLKEQYLSWENSKVKFFSLNNLPKIKKKQQDLINEIKDFLKSKNLHH